MTSQRSALVASGKSYRTEGISRRVRGITISAIKEMPLLASRIGGCVSLGQGIPSFATPRHIVDAVFRAMIENPDGGKYTLGPGLPELREAVAKELGVKAGVPVDGEREICITVGAMEALAAAVLTVVDRGDEVILPSPNYASHIEQVLLAEGVPVFVPLEEGAWQLDVERIEDAVTPKTRAIILCNPHNPTGANFREEDLRAVAEMAARRNIFLIADETYDFLVYDGESHFSLTGHPGNQRPAHRHVQLFEEVCHDRVARRLRVRSRSHSGPDDEDPRRRRHLCPDSFPGRGSGGSRGSPGLCPGHSGCPAKAQGPHL